MLGRCLCPHKGQDELHGVGIRVLNHVPSKGTLPDEYRCTVCGREFGEHEVKRK